MAISQVVEQAVRQAELSTYSDTGSDGAGEGGQDSGADELRWAAKAQGSACEGRRSSELRKDSDERVERAVKPAGKVVGGRGGHDPPGLADEQWLTYRAFEATNLAGDCRLGQSELLCGTGQCPSAVHRVKGPQKIQRRRVRAHAAQTAIENPMDGCC